MRLSEKLGAACAAAAILPLLTASALTYYATSSAWRNRAIDQLQTETNAATGLYEKRLAEMRLAVAQLAGDIANRAVVSSGAAGDAGAAWARLQDLLPRAQDEFSLDFILIADPTGRVIARHNDRPAGDETVLGQEPNQVAQKAISEGSQLRNAAAAAAVVERADQLARLGLALTARVTRPDGTAVDEALMVESAAPIISAGRFIGVVLIGQMLNTYYAPRPGGPLRVPLVTEIRQTLYRAENSSAGALIALGDTIIASSIPPGGGSGEPALKGTRREPAGQYEVVEGGGASYAVVWHPLKSFGGEQVGALGAAVSAASFDGPRGVIRALFFIVGLLGLALAGAGGYFLGRRLALRVNGLRESVNRISLGDLSAPVKDPGPDAPLWMPAFLRGDEISRLSTALDEMRDSFKQAIDRIRKR